MKFNIYFDIVYQSFYRSIFKKDSSKHIKIYDQYEHENRLLKQYSMYGLKKLIIFEGKKDDFKSK